MRDFLEVDMVCQVLSPEIALFGICTIIVDEFGKLYEDNGSVIEMSHLTDLNIVWQLRFLYTFFSYLHLTRFQSSISTFYSLA